MAAVICGMDIQTRPDGGTDVVATDDRIDDVEALLTALRLPDEPPRESCPAIINGVPWLAPARRRTLVTVPGGRMSPTTPGPR